MKANTKKSTSIITIIVLTMLFLLSMSVSYAYFTAMVSLSAEGAFGNVQVYWAYKIGDDLTVYNGNTLALTLASSPSIGGSAVGFKYDSSNISEIQITKANNSSDCYVRFWVDAYVAGDATNYGKYFLLNCGSIYDSALRDNGANLNYNRIYYYIASDHTGVLDGRYKVCDGISIISTAPIELSGASVDITITFEAVQAANEAYKSVFNDWKGYHAYWDEE